DPCPARHLRCGRNRHARGPRRDGVAIRSRVDASRHSAYDSFSLLRSPHVPLRVGVAGPVGSGKATPTQMLYKHLRSSYDICVIANDIYTKEDAEILMRAQALPLDRIMAVETGGCPHTAIREDCSINLAAIDTMRRRFPSLDLILIESGGDNLAATFSPELADLTVYVKLGRA